MGLPPKLMNTSIRLNKAVRLILAVILMALMPSLVLANGLIPAINAYRNTPAFYFIFTVVILLESLCIRLWLRRLHFGAVLWRVIAINAASSLAGYLLIRTRLHPDFMAVWQQAIPFFFLTLLVEVPLVFILFRRSLRSWKNTLLMATASNLISYAVLIAAERPIESVWLDRLRAEDLRTLQAWTNTGMLAELPGVIYGTESPGGGKHRLRRLDLRDCTWHSMTNCPPIHPAVWDVEGDLVAFMHYAEEGYSQGSITVRTIPDFTLVQELSLTNEVYPNGGWSLRLSPDGGKLAVLVPHHEIQAPLQGSSYRCFGTVSELVVFDTTTGVILGTSPRKAMQGGLCWLPDSDTVLFSSLRDESLHSLARLNDNWQKEYREPEKLFADAPTYAYDIPAGTVKFFGEMSTPHLAAKSMQLLYKNGKEAIDIHDLEHGGTHEVPIGPLGYRDIEVSPNGRFVIAPLTLTHPLGYLGYPTIVDLEDPSRRHYIEGIDYRLDWTTLNRVEQPDPHR